MAELDGNPDYLMVKGFEIPKEYFGIAALIIGVYANL